MALVEGLLLAMVPKQLSSGTQIKITGSHDYLSSCRKRRSPTSPGHTDRPCGDPVALQHEEEWNSLRKEGRMHQKLPKKKKKTEKGN